MYYDYTIDNVPGSHKFNSIDDLFNELKKTHFLSEAMMAKIRKDTVPRVPEKPFHTLLPKRWTYRLKAHEWFEIREHFK